MFKLTITIICLTTLSVAPPQDAFAQEELTVEALAEMADTEEVAVEEGQIKLPLRNPFVPQIPVAVETVIVEIDGELTEVVDTTAAVIERTIEYVEPKITGTPVLYISGVIWNSERPQAIVNGNIIEVGDRLFKVPTSNRETIPELKFVDISKEGLAVAYEDKIIIIKPELPKE